MSVTIVTFDRMTASLREELGALTNPGRSRFRDWLQLPPPLDARCVACVLGAGRPTGWAAANLDLNGGWPPPTTGMVGVFVHPDHRGRGLARELIGTLLDVLRTYEVPPLLRWRGAPWIGREILAAGFRDLWSEAGQDLATGRIDPEEGST